MRPLFMLFFLVLCAPRAAQAEEFTPPLTLELALTDLGAVALGIVATQAQPTGTTMTSALGRGVATAAGVGALVAPTLYFAGQQTTRGFASLALRLTLPTAFAAFGGAVALFRMECVRPSMLLGSAVGLATAIAVDLAVISRARVSRRDRSERAWYGYQLLILDGVGLATGVVVAGLTARDRPLLRRDPDSSVIPLPFFTWAVAWFFGAGAPVIHWAHKEVGAGVVSAVLRTFGTPLLGVVGLTGYCAAVAGEEGCGGVGFSWGALSGAVSIMMIDAFVNGRRKPRRTSGSVPVVVVPLALDGGAGVGIAHRF